MIHALPSALVTNKGQRVLFRIDGKVYELTQAQLRTLLGLPAGATGLGISIDNNRFSFEFSDDAQAVELSARQLQRRLAKQATAKR